ncbi:MAG TPA: SWIM zinc finger family protein [Ilumatobacteraceae bacterium]|nr:SWIM zinc finger family protein [Ilumatobacteraceae bacterium]
MWSVEQVEAVAPTPAALTAARPLVSLTRWGSVGVDERVVWGTCRGSGAEPYDTMVDHVGVGYSCTCPSRRRPCKHALALLLLWVDGQIAVAVPPPPVESWISRRRASAERASVTSTGSEVTSQRDGTESVATSESPPADDGADEHTEADASEGERDRARDERVERMHAGLAELDRWLDDRMRTGLADPALARYSTWDDLAARLVDARAGSLANRIRRLAGLVGASPDWHSDVLAELGLLHLLAQAGRRLGSLPAPLADSVATAVGWQVRQADVLAGVPETDDWIVVARSDTREDRIEVRRHWLRGGSSGRWALLLSFAAYRQSLDTSLAVGTSLTADLHRYPGPALRALVGHRYGEPVQGARPPAGDLATACDGIGALLVAEPWLDRVPFTATASVASRGSGFALTDDSGSLPILVEHRAFASLLAVSAGEPVDVSGEWTPHGVVPLTVHLDGRSIDIGPRADESFVSAA